MTEKIDVNELFENAMKDPTLFSTMDVEKLLESIENDKNDYLQNKSMKIITQEIYKTIQKLQLPEKTRFEYCQKLIGYRLVDDVHELHVGKHVRWIREQVLTNGLAQVLTNGLAQVLTNGQVQVLTNGGIVTTIKFLDNGTQVLCKSNGLRFIQFKFDECIIFQKMSLEEQLIMMAYDYIEKT
uniref:Uncharacterized protein n=1 Tax=viral metagenome TaxID=1070528 RepID=A0A6C0L6R2_9ZZZZ